MSQVSKIHPDRLYTLEGALAAEFVGSGSYYGDEVEAAAERAADRLGFPIAVYELDSEAPAVAVYPGLESENAD